MREDGYEISIDEALLNIEVDRTDNKTNEEAGQTAAKTSDDNAAMDTKNNDVNKKVNALNQRDNETKQDPSFADQTNAKTKNRTNKPIQVNNETGKDTPETDRAHIETKSDVKETRTGTVDGYQTNTVANGNNKDSQAEDAFLPSMKDAFLGDVPYLIEGSEYPGLDGRYMAVDRNSDTVHGDEEGIDESAAAGASEAVKTEENVPNTCVHTLFWVNLG